MHEATSNGRLADKVAIITGAGNGIGRATAVRFAQEGAAVVIADVDAEQGRAAARAIEDAGGRAQFVEANVARRASTDAMAEAAADAFGRIDILVNNAGITRDARLQKMSEDAFDQVIDVNLKGVFNATKSVLPHMLEAAPGASSTRRRWWGCTATSGRRTTWRPSRASSG